MISPYGARVAAGRTHFAVHAPAAKRVWLCVSDGEDELRLPMDRIGDDWTTSVEGDCAGMPYGYRADGEYAPDRGLWFDPAKLLVDPCAIELDRRFVQHPALARYGEDTGDLVPRARVPAPLDPVPHRAPLFEPGGLIYEVNVRSLTLAHPAVPLPMAGTVAALAHPAIIAHLKALHVTAVELMPIVAWIDERHLPPLGLVNAWGYNPVAPMALDPGLCPGGVAELRETVAALHAAGIGVILDIVLNHTGESDVSGGTLCLRGLDPAAYARDADGTLINDTGCGNTLDFANPRVRRLAVDTLRHFVRHCGIDGFRFDLATVLVRGPGFSPAAPFLAEVAADPLLRDRILIAEPWDIGPGGYQLGRFPPNWLEWNDRFRDDVRRFWRGDGSLGDLATRLAGSADLFGQQCRSVNFIAAHDGFSLADTVAFVHRHNHANGEDNRDGHGSEISWNNGAEGPSADPAVMAARAADQRALLATLFASTGAIMLTAGDEFGHSRRGNNNAYCQDNAFNWLNWDRRDRDLEQFVCALSAERARRRGSYAAFPQDGLWTRLDGQPMQAADWDDPATSGFAWHPADPLDRAPITVHRAQRLIRG